MLGDAQWLLALTSIGAIEKDSTEHPVHVRLASGMCSDIYADMWELYSFPHLYVHACAELLEKGGFTGPQYGLWFVGLERGCIPLGYELARQMSGRAGFVRKPSLERAASLVACNPLPKNEIVIVEDVLTTGRSALVAWEACVKAGFRVKPVILALVNRSGLDSLYLPAPSWASPIRVPIISVVAMDARGTNPSSCHKCRAGEKPERR